MYIRLIHLYLMKLKCNNKGYAGIILKIVFLCSILAGNIAQAQSPAPITGVFTVCVGATTSLTDVTTGGTWSSSATSFATVNTSGIVTGFTAGTVTITYTHSGSYVTAVVTINPLPNAGTITGAAVVCEGASIVLSDGVTGGVWSSGSTGIAHVGSTGIVTGESAGTATISYVVTNSCGSAHATTVVTANGTSAAINGTAAICPSFSTTLTDNVTGGTWSSSNTAVGTINATTGAITAIASTNGDGGTTTISYVTPSCGVATGIFNRYPDLPIGNGLARIVHVGDTIMLFDSSSGGTWSSTNTAEATVGTSGIVTGIASLGIPAFIQYTNTYGCIASIDVNVFPADISGATVICQGGTANLSDASTGGTWSSNNTSIAAVGSTGVVTGISAGTTFISYTTTGGWSVVSVTVDPLPNAGTIMGIGVVCVGATTNLSDNGTTGGSWSSGAPSIATVGSAGVVTGTAAGTAMISYTLSNSCGNANAVTVITVNPTVAPIQPIPGGGQICVGGTMTLTDASPGTWSSTNTAAITVSTSGVVTCISDLGGSALIQYTSLLGCGIYSVDVNIFPAVTPIAGNLNICQGSTTSLSDSGPFSSWSSSNTGIATVGTTGLVTSVSVGTAVITFEDHASPGCTATTVVTVNSSTISAGTITGVTSLCIGGAISLTDAIAGGVWTSGSTGVATVGTTGLVTGVSTGTVIISYIVTGLCGSTYATAVVSVNNTSAGTINGPSSVSAGSNISLTDAVTGGIWSASNSDVTISCGIVTGVTAGTVIISYAVTGVCGTAYATKIITVNNSSIPGINGNTVICAGATTILSDASIGGVWTSSNGAIATVGSGTGVVTGVNSGAVTITYTLGSSYQTIAITINPNPALIQGTVTECAGTIVTVLDATPGGTWSGTGDGVVSGTGTSATFVAGVLGGTATVTYTLPTGCFTTSVNVIAPNPTPILGMTTVCVGGVTMLSDSSTDVLWWSSSNTLVATVAGGDVTGVSVGSVIITYKILPDIGTTGTGCMTTTTLNVIAPPASITGNTGPVCPGSTLLLTDGTGTWASSNTAVAQIDPSTGIVTGMTGGTARITYSATGAAGCVANTIVSVSVLPAITGTPTVCIGGTSVLHDAVTGGSWSSGFASIATISAIGLVTGLSAGTAIITYTTASGCMTMLTVTVSGISVAINGNLSICQGATTSLSDVSTGGTWSMSSLLATVGSATGVVTASASLTGTTTVSYTTAVCSATAILTINSNPTPIQGTNTECAGLSVTLTDTSSGGSWSATGDGTILGTGSMATFTSGIVGGTATVTYTIATGCMTMVVNTIAANPAPIMGLTTVCVGGITILTDASTGVLSWSSSNTAVATSAGGNISGISVGSSVITYKILPVIGATGTGCMITTTVNVIAPPASISGNTGALCPGSTMPLTDGVGIWTSNNSTVATIGSSSGIVTGNSGGTAIITYSASGASGCVAHTTITVSPTPTITGTSTVCIGGTSVLHDVISGGTWSSGSTSVATISLAGVVTGVSSGTTTITYTTLGGCMSMLTITVSSVPVGIYGNLSVCQGATTALSDVSSGGTWSMSSLLASVGSTTGVVTASASLTGTTTVSYTTSVCSATAILTINPNPTPIQGTNTECAGLTISLTDTSSGGTWSSSGDGTLSVTGSVAAFTAGIAAGTATITFTIPSGCMVTMVNVIATNPAPITGLTTVCVGGTTILSDASTYVLWWSSGNTAVATSAGGNITGVSVGSATITYKILPDIGTTGTGCMTTTTVNVIAPVAAISGNTGVLCPGSTLSLTDGVGIWTSNNYTVINIGSSTGIVTGITGGTAIITYSASGVAGCVANTIVTVSPIPTITGTATICTGGTTALHDAVAGGTWSSGSTAIASVSAAGVVTGISGGTAVITYSTAAGCTSMLTVTVNDVSVAINGNLAVCQGSTTSLTDSSPGGTWNMSSTIASVGAATGIVTASASLTGTVTISYTSGSCFTTAIVTVNPKPTPIQGATAECAGLTIYLSDATAGGAWSSSGNVTVTGTGAAATLVAGSISGTATVTYTVATGCFATAGNTVYASPQPIMGNQNMCVGLVTLLSDASPVSSWSSSNTAVAVASGADISGVSAGTAIITFKSSAAGTCITTLVVTVNAMPVVSIINGPASISHAGGPVSISDSTAGGIWTSSNTSVIALSGSTGSPIQASALTSTGSSVIAYAVTVSGCTTKVTKTFSTAAATHSQGTTSVIAGSAVSLADDATGGVWESSDDGIATVDASGLLTGRLPGNVSITYTVSGFDGTVINVTDVAVRPLPLSLTLLPNPNKGTFIVKGTLGVITDEEVTLEVVDLLGRVLYHNKITAQGGKLETTISLGNTIASGMYILDVQSGSEHQSFHFVVEQ